MAEKNAGEALRLKRYAVQIATQLPENREEALRVLEFAREIVEWGTQAETAGLRLIRATG